MRLPTSLLEQVEYYERVVRDTDYGYYTKITLHYKKWWRLRKVMKFEWDNSGNDLQGNKWYKEPKESILLSNQLYEYFKDK